MFQSPFDEFKCQGTEKTPAGFSRIWVHFQFSRPKIHSYGVNQSNIIQIFVKKEPFLGHER